jgi:hypothetical protein
MLTIKSIYPTYLHRASAAYLGEEVDLKADALSIARASVHVVAHEQDELKHLGKLSALFQLL